MLWEIFSDLILLIVVIWGCIIIRILEWRLWYFPGKFPNLGYHNLSVVVGIIYLNILRTYDFFNPKSAIKNPKSCVNGLFVQALNTLHGRRVFEFQIFLLPSFLVGLGQSFARNSQKAGLLLPFESNFCIMIIFQPYNLHFQFITIYRLIVQLTQVQLNLFWINWRTPYKINPNIPIEMTIAMSLSYSIVSRASLMIYPRPLEIPRNSAGTSTIHATPSARRRLVSI